MSTRVTKDEVLQTYQRVRARYMKYKTRYHTLVGAYKDMENENEKMKVSRQNYH